MSLRSFMSRLPKRSLAALTVLGAIVLVPAALHAWGPARTTFTVAQPADHVVFNSITDNPVVGDERQFVGIKDNATTTSGGWQNSIVAQPGHEYLVRVYVHNNAASNLNLVAQNTRVTAALSTATGTNVPITAYVSADNASPQKVWADVSLTANQAFNIAYVPGSTMLYNNVTGQAGRAVSDSIVNPGGALIGYQSNDGKVPGCFQYASYLTFKVKAQFPTPTNTDFSVTKQVRKNGQTGSTTWSKSVSVNPGDLVDYMISYKNTGAVVQNNVALYDTLPQGISYVAGTTYLANGSNPNGAKIDDGVTTSKGINIGNYAPGATAYVKFTAKVGTNDQLAVCGINTLDNTAKIITDYGSKSDDATVTVTKDCPPVKDITVCRLSDKQIVSIKENEYDTAKYSKNLDDCKDVTVCRLADKKVVTITVSAYNADKSKYSTNLDDCKETPPPVKDITVCRLSDKTIVTIKEDQFDTEKYSKDLNKCKETPPSKDVKVCRLDDKQIVTISEDEYNQNKSKYSTNLKDCATKPPVLCTVPGKETMPADSPDCKVTPPTELPHTGITDGFITMLGAGSLVGMAGAFAASRRAVKQS